MRSEGQGNEENDGGWYDIRLCQPPKKYEVHWKRPNSRSKTGYSNMTTLVSPEYLVQVEGTYDPNTGKAQWIIAEWLHEEERWQWDGSQEFKQEELIWYRELPEPRRE